MAPAPSTTRLKEGMATSDMFGSSSEQDDDEVNRITADAGGGDCELIYKQKSNSKKVLMVMAYGIKARDQNIGD